MILSPMNTGASSYSDAWFGQGTGPILLNNVNCSGNEHSLINCMYTASVHTMMMLEWHAEVVRLREYVLSMVGHDCCMIYSSYIHASA